MQDVAVRAADERTLVVELEGPVGYFLQLVACAGTFPLPRHIVATTGEAWSRAGEIVGNGPFQLTTWSPGEAMVLRRSPQYHGRPRGNVNQVEVALLGEDESAELLERCEVAQLDALDMLAFPAAIRDRARQRHPDEYVTQPALSTAYVGFDTSRPPFDDVRVRRALALATDKEWLADVVLGADESPATGGFVPAGMPGHSPGTSLPHDPVQARALLAEAGYPGGRSFPPVDAVTISGSESYGGYPGAFWQEHLGLEIQWETLDWLSYFPRMEQNPPHLFGLGWVADYTPTLTAFSGWAFFGTTPIGRIRPTTGWWKGPGGAKDQAERMRLYAQADRILVEEVPILPLAYQRNHFLFKPWLRVYPTSPIRSLFWKDVIIEPH